MYSTMYRKCGYLIKKSEVIKFLKNLIYLWCRFHALSAKPYCLFTFDAVYF